MDDFLTSNNMRVHIAQEEDISYVTVFNRDRTVLWKKGPPTDMSWQDIWLVHDVLDRVRHGSYQYVNGMQENRIFIVFTPFGGFDFNSIFDIHTGEQLGYSASR